MSSRPALQPHLCLPLVTIPAPGVQSAPGGCFELRAGTARL